MTLDRSIPNCPQCHSADDVRPPSLNPDGDLEFLCNDQHSGEGPIVFLRLSTPRATGGTGRAQGIQKLETRKTDDLLDPLLACISPTDGWLEYGVLEHRLHKLAPEVFARHVAEAGHIMFGRKSSTASGVRFAMALRRLAVAGHVRSEIRRSTGAAWKHDVVISFWRAIPTGPTEAKSESAHTLTWSDYCEQLGRIDDWTPDDREGLASPSQEPTDPGARLDR